MSKEYVAQLEATIENLRRDNQLLKELNVKYKNLEEKIGCPLEVIAKMRETKTCYTYTGEVCSHIEVLTKCDVSALDVCDNLFVVGYETKDGYVLGHELKFKEYKINWWLKPDRSE